MVPRSRQVDKRNFMVLEFRQVDNMPGITLFVEDLKKLKRGHVVGFHIRSSQSIEPDKTDKRLLPRIKEAEFERVSSSMVAVE